MALQAVGAGMCSREREGGHAVIEGIVCIPGGVAGQTGGAIIGVSGHAIVIIIRLRVHVAGDAGKLSIIGRIGMAVQAGIPFPLVLATVNGEVLHVMIEGGRDPARFTVTGCTVCGEHQRPMIGIAGLVIVCLVTTGTGGGCIEIISIMAGRTIVGDQSVGSVQWIEIVVIGKKGRVPVGIRGVAGGTIHGEAQVDMVGIDRLVEIVRMTGGTLRRGAGIACRMAGGTIDIEVTAGQWEGRQVMIKDILRISGGVAGQAGRTGIGVPVDPAVVIIRLRIHMAGDTGEYAVVRRVSMTLCAGGPFTLVLAGVDRKIDRIMFLIFRRIPPGIGGVASGTVRRESGLDMIGIQGGLKIRLMAGQAFGRGVLIAAIGVTLGTVVDGVSQGQWEKAVVDLVGIPVDLVDVVALGTIGREIILDVIRAGGGLVVLEVAIDAIIPESVKTQC